MTEFSPNALERVTEAGAVTGWGFPAGEGPGNAASILNILS